MSSGRNGRSGGVSTGAAAATATGVPAGVVGTGVVVDGRATALEWRFARCDAGMATPPPPAATVVYRRCGVATAVVFGAGAGLTITVAFMSGWMEQIYAYVPAVVNV